MGGICLYINLNTPSSHSSSPVSITALTYCSYVELSLPPFFLPDCSTIMIVERPIHAKPLENSHRLRRVVCELDQKLVVSIKQRQRGQRIDSWAEKRTKTSLSTSEIYSPENQREIACSVITHVPYIYALEGKDEAIVTDCYRIPRVFGHLEL